MQFPAIVQPNIEQLSVPYLAKMQEIGQAKQKEALVDRALKAYRTGQDPEERNMLQQQSDQMNGGSVKMDRQTAAAILQRHAPELYTTIQKEESSALRDAYHVLGDAEKIPDPEERAKLIKNEYYGLKRKYPNANLNDIPPDNELTMEYIKRMREQFRPFSGELGAKGEAYTLGKGQKRFVDGQVVAENTDNSPETQVGKLIAERDAIAAQNPNDPRIATYESAIQKAITSKPMVSIDMAGEGLTEATKKYGQGIGDRANKRMERAFSAQQQNSQLDRVALAIANGATTGMGAETLLDLKNFGQTFLGMDFGEEVGEQEVIRKVSNEMALRLRNPESGLGLTGNTSNKDLDFLKNSVLGLARTPQGNAMIIDVMKKFNNVTLKMAKKQSEIIRENGGVVPTDLDEQLMSYVDRLDILSDDQRRKIEALSKAAPAAASAPKNNKGWTLHTDANGNKAYVSPDGTQFEEVQ